MLFLFIPKLKNRVIFSSEFNLTYKHNSKFLFEYFIKHYPEKETKFVINDANLRSQLTSEIGDYFIESESFLGMLYVLRAKTWVVSSLETPVGGLFLNVRRYVYHLGHGTPIKNIGLLEKYTNVKKKMYLKLIRNNFSYFFSTSEAFRSTWAGFTGVKLNKVVIMGQARNDVLYTPDEALFDRVTGGGSGKRVLYAPTWRAFGETNLFPFDGVDIKRLFAFLQQNNITIFLRLHPNFETSVPNELLTSDRVKLLSSKDVVEINDILGAFDLLISDYSSIYIDFLVTHKPILFLPYDYSKYKQEIGFTIPYQQYTPGPKPTTQDDFEFELKKLIFSSDYYHHQRVQTNNELNPLDGDNCQRNSEFIVNHLQ